MTRHRNPIPWILLLLAATPGAAQHEPRVERGRPEERREMREERRGRRPMASRPAEPGGAPQHRRGGALDRPPRTLEGFENGGRPPERHGEARGRTALPLHRGEGDVRAWQARGGWHRNAWPAHSTWREHRAQRWASDHRTWSQRGGYGGYVIPEIAYHRAFGDRHGFRIGACPVIYEGYPRFRHGGYWFFIVDPWPEFWADDWYAWDDVFITYDSDGYYLFNLRHPGARLAVMVSF